MRNIEMRHLRYFIAVADSQSIIGASRELNIAQPALSRQIKDLEDLIGAELLSRHTKGVQLTDAGRYFLGRARQILADTRDARNQACLIGDGRSGFLKIGVVPGYLSLPRTLSALQHFRRMQPNVVLSVEPLLSQAQAHAIRLEKLDGGIMAGREIADTSLRGLHLYRERFLLAIPDDLVDRSIFPNVLADVATKPFIWFNRERSPLLHDSLIAECKMANFVPHVVQFGTDMPTVLELVAAGMGCAFVPAGMSRYCASNVKLIELKDLTATFDVEFVFGSYPSATVKRFIESLHHVLDHCRPPAGDE